MKTFKLVTIILGGVLLTACDNKKEEGKDEPPKAKDAYIQIDNSKNEPVTQKNDPYGTGAKNSRFFATTTLDLSQKSGSTGTIVQVLLQYVLDNKTSAEEEANAKALWDGIAEGASINVKILGDNSRTLGSHGFLLSGSASATTGVWDYFYSGENDLDIEITKVDGKLQMVMASPASLSMVKRGGAGDPNFPGFDGELQFTVLMPR